jgi:hypothetical protein
VIEFLVVNMIGMMLMLGINIGNSEEPGTAAVVTIVLWPVFLPIFIGYFAGDLSNLIRKRLNENP